MLLHLKWSIIPVAPFAEAIMPDPNSFTALVTAGVAWTAQQERGAGWGAALADLGTAGDSEPQEGDPMCYAEAARAGARQLAPLPAALAALGQALLLRARLAAELRDHCRCA